MIQLALVSNNFRLIVDQLNKIQKELMYRHGNAKSLHSTYSYVTITIAEQFTIFLDKEIVRYFFSSLENCININFFKFHFKTEFMSHASLSID